jgi:carbamate kinase
MLSAVQDVPNVSLTALSRDPDGMIRATLAAAKVDDINSVLLALQAAAYKEVAPYPLDILGAESVGMIGYLVEQELAHLLF